jgi:hypothetical protein
MRKLISSVSHPAIELAVSGVANVSINNVGVAYQHQLNVMKSYVG